MDNLTKTEETTATTSTLKAIDDQIKVYERALNDAEERIEYMKGVISGLRTSKSIIQLANEKGGINA